MGQQCTLQMPARDNNARYLGHPVELNNNRLAGRKNKKIPMGKRTSGNAECHVLTMKLHNPQLSHVIFISQKLKLNIFCKYNVDQ